MRPFYLYSDLPSLGEHKVWAEIDTDALLCNYNLLCSLTSGVRHICAVKADSYGHVSEICVRVLLHAGCDFFAVSCVEEAISVRQICESENKRADILILGYTDCRQVPILVENDIIQTVISENYAEEINRYAEDAGKRLRVHIALDTGMNRIGICAQNPCQISLAADLVEHIYNMNGIAAEGLFTHYAKADEAFEGDVEKQTSIQFERFLAVRDLLHRRGIDLFCHTCNSAAAVRFPEYRLDGVRFGITLYGLPPSKHVEVDVTPIMSLHTVISHIHTLPVGESVSYGGRFCSDEEKVIATLPIGYADGFLRAYNSFCVTVNTDSGDYPAPVVGNICMDQCMIDITGIPAKVGDKITIFGKDIKAIRRLAEMANTIEYEVLCLISTRVPRIIKKHT